MASAHSRTRRGATAAAAAAVKGKGGRCRENWGRCVPFALPPPPPSEVFRVHGRGRMGKSHIGCVKQSPKQRPRGSNMLGACKEGAGALRMEGNFEQDTHPEENSGHPGSGRNPGWPDPRLSTLRGGREASQSPLRFRPASQFPEVRGHVQRRRFMSSGRVGRAGGIPPISPRGKARHVLQLTGRKNMVVKRSDLGSINSEFFVKNRVNGGNIDHPPAIRFQRPN